MYSSDTPVMHMIFGPSFRLVTIGVNIWCVVAVGKYCIVTLVAVDT